ncbi:MAG: NADH-quinone oxidoreductase subunit NuoE [Phycisphaerae bacterium]|nr:NADH-quinone oxidoreductase subunit NuoE [Planctomycetota bacterium]MBL7221307.1 NADH-quinone oxidoreductase subunit NuoE [Phycisphaerae bacterium]
MLVSNRNRLDRELDVLIDKCGRQRTALMPILQAVQRKYGFIRNFAMQKIADALSIHPVEVHGVVTFYSFLSEKPRGRFIIRLCRTISCEMAGKDRVAAQLETELGIKFGETTVDKRFTLEWANCMGLCDQGPAMLVNDTHYTRVTPQRVLEILEECRSRLSPHAMQGAEEEHLV